MSSPITEAAAKEYPKLILWVIKQTPMVILLAVLNYVQWIRNDKLETKIENMQSKLDNCNLSRGH